MMDMCELNKNNVFKLEISLNDIIGNNIDVIEFDVCLF